MAHTNHTSNYELSQFLGTDKPAWLIDYNGDMEKIDLGMKAAQDVADAAKEEADQGALDIAAVTVTANSADTKASAAISDLADAYDATSTYVVGDYVTYNYILYRCITPITVPEAFDGTHWERVTVEEVLAGLTSDVSLLNLFADKIKGAAVYEHSVTLAAGSGTTFFVRGGNNFGVIFTADYSAELLQFFVQDENYGFLIPAIKNGNNAWTTGLTNDRRLSIRNNTALERKAHVLIFEKL